MKNTVKGLVPLSQVEKVEISGASCPKRYYYNAITGTLSTTKPGI